MSPYIDNIVDTGDQFIAGLVDTDTGEQLTPGVVDTGNQLISGVIDTVGYLFQRRVYAPHCVYNGVSLFHDFP